MIAGLIAAAALTVTPASRAMQPGEPVLLTITCEQPLTSIKVTSFHADTAGYEPDPAKPRRWQALIGIDLDVAPGVYTVHVAATSSQGPVVTDLRIHVLAKKFPTRRLSVDEAFVNPPESARARIEAESKETASIFANSAPARLWTAFERPVMQAANSAFGTRSVFNGQPRSAHSGADFLSPAGTPVKAAASGRVMLAKNLYYSGNTVIIDHGLGVFSLFAHFSRIDVAAGDVVTAGQIVGLVGATGRVTGPHLHWTVRVAGARVDPLGVLAVLASPAAAKQPAEKRPARRSARRPAPSLPPHRL
jgi:murein DD-endopeptidase MepM/ murein hydrolase activator NlpD